eukprot:m.306567 g.306567  ORF g.306567 m.306567 type:complete len:65 (+) comp16352_c0_seq1:2821-3015(+)
MGCCAHHYRHGTQQNVDTRQETFQSQDGHLFRLLELHATGLGLAIQKLASRRPFLINVKKTFRS